MRIRRKHILFLCGAILACVAGALIAGGVRSSHPEDVSASSPTAPHAAVAKVARETIASTLSIAGEFLPYQEVELHAKVAGYIRKINVDIGDHVHTGQVMAILEVPELKAQVQQADAEVRHSGDEIDRADQEVKRAKANYIAVHAAYLRLKQAGEQRPGLIAEQELDDALAKDGSAEAQMEAAKSASSAAKQQLDVSKASREHYSAMSDYSRIIAPFDGVVTWRYADTGALIQAGTSNESSMPVVKLAQIDVLRLRIPVPESLASSVREGEPAEIRVQATGKVLHGKVTRFTNSLDRSTRSMQVEVDLPNPGYELSPGMYANVSLRVQNQPNALTIPVQALKKTATKNLVLIVNSEDRVEQREITLGIEDPDRVQVLSGLNESDRVIVGNLASFQPGQKVVPKLSTMVDAKYSETEAQ
ncbi:MAG TPA: efflux RND transporter periplasmic adaptor subunit [Candidatus Angelobacter sp.]|nr:efflux RND transporter periplasmic adaptor subunit [Candidatus Angelobacter sp.]